MVDKPILLPRPHLSYSQWSCWKTNPERYRREYFEKGAKLDTKYLRFGKGIAKLIEEGKHKELLPGLPVFPIHELEINIRVRGVPILSFLDGDDDANLRFGEYKTGKIAWTKARVQKHEQLPFYAVAKRALTGRMPTSADLIWIETKDTVIDEADFWSRVDQTIQVTGRIEVFTREFDERELDRVEADILKVALEISAAYKEYIVEMIH